MSFDSIVGEVADERIAQDKQWCHEFDDRNTVYNWAAYITQYMTRHLIGDPTAVDEKEVRSDLVKVAAIAFAAVESIDRRAK